MTERFRLALAFSLMAHLLLLQLPTAMRGGALRTWQAVPLDVRLAANLSETVAAPAPSVAPNPPAEATSDDPVLAGIPIPTRYFRSDEVDRRAEPADLAPLIYPERAFGARIRGSVRLRVFVNELGGIDAIDVVDAEPRGMFEQAAIDAVTNTRFAPAELLGRPVKNVKVLEIRFDPDRDDPADGAAAAR